MLVDVLKFRAFKDGVTVRDGRNIELKRRNVKISPFQLQANQDIPGQSWLPCP